tara:strand:- start:141 stop:551 length:411 start_codon:yes stop_codon:yes gene_type:complete
MARKSKAKFTMKGHALPGVNQKSETVNVTDGRSPSSAFQQNYDNIARIDHKEGTDENIAAHKKNKTETYKSDLSADEMNAKLAKTRHLAADEKEATLPDPKKKYPKNEKEPKVKKTRKKRRFKIVMGGNGPYGNLK